MVAATSWLSIIFTLLILASDLPPLIWDANDRNDIPEPSDRDISIAYDFVTASFGRPVIRLIDLPHHIRWIARQHKEAANVNAVDEVPNSSWYTNRNFLYPMNTEDIARGPNRQTGPSKDGQWTVTKCKTTGLTPGLQIKDSKGDLYFIKFDPDSYPDLMTGAEVIGSKVFYAAGYNVPENSIVEFQPKTLEVPEGMECQLKGKDLTGSGKVRAVASKFLDGKPKGPFSYTGWRADDPNDILPHENRRELRGLRVIASFVNHNDLKQINTLDMYVEENGRRFLKHHLIDFGATLGSATIKPKGSQEGYQYIFDTIEILKSALTLGLHKRPAQRKTSIVHPSLGYLESDTFDPGEWKANLPIAPFQKMTDRDAYWGAKIVASFTDDQLEAIVRTGEYSDREASEQLLRILKVRRDKVADYWFRRSVAPLDRFRYEGDELVFDDLAVIGGYDCKDCPTYDIKTSEKTVQITRTSSGWPEQRVTVHIGLVNGKPAVLGVER